MSKYKPLLLPLIIFSALFIPYLFLVPSNDGNLEFTLSSQWLHGQNIFYLISFHPPFKLILFSIFFKLFGYSSFGFVGLLLGLTGVTAVYFIAKKLFDEKVALLSSLLLATSGLYISVALFSVHDFVMTVLMILAFAFYVNSRYVWYAIFICLAILTKETAIFMALGIIFTDVVLRKKVSFSLFTPIIILFWYVEFVHFSGYHLWNDWNFSPTAKEGSAATMINNILTLQLFNKYAWENMLHLFIFNFNWVYWVFVIASLFYVKTKELKQHLVTIGIFVGLFTLLVLTFQTFTINRYILPLIPFVYLFASYAVFKLKFSKLLISLLLITSVVSLFFSIDPVSNLIWQKTQVLDQNLYLNKKLDGDDGITYNMQYLNLMKERTTMIKNGQCTFPHLIPRDNHTLALLNIHTCK
ncbi:MAG TPA: glycosyltransferase family 39 protein [Candidatus Saccharimonadales bacterium]|nr:glycosyltransferase family 39 protein [Candidatus Saccharimonadales bacterium]